MLRTLLICFISVWMLAQAPDPGASQPPAPQAPASQVVKLPSGALVTFRDQPLFKVQGLSSQFSPEARAKAIQGRLERILEDPLQSMPKLALVEAENASEIFCGETLLMIVTEEDAKAENASRQELAKKRLEQLDVLLASQTWTARLRRTALIAFYALLVTLGGAIVWRALGIGMAQARKKVQSIDPERFPHFKIQNLELISESAMRSLTLKALGFVHALGVILLGYVYLSIVFSFFPATRGLAYKLFSLLWHPFKGVLEGFIDYLPKLFFIIVIIFVTRYILKGIQLIFKGIDSGLLKFNHFHTDWSEPTYKLVRIFVMAFALVAAFPYLPGSGSEAFKGISLFFGLVFSLGSSGAVSNAVSGVLITYMRPFKVGDVICAGETTGCVVEKSLLVTRIRTPKNVDITIPNALLLNAQVQNYSEQAATKGLILHTTVTIGYDVPWRQVHELLIAAAAATPDVLSDPKPFVLQTSLDDFYVSYQINAYTQNPGRMAGILSDLHTQILEKFNAAGVEIMSPHYRANRDGSPITIPAKTEGA